MDQPKNPNDQPVEPSSDATSSSPFIPTLFDTGIGKPTEGFKAFLANLPEDALTSPSLLHAAVDTSGSLSARPEGDPASLWGTGGTDLASAFQHIRKLGERPIPFLDLPDEALSIGPRDLPPAGTLEDALGRLPKLPTYDDAVALLRSRGFEPMSVRPLPAADLASSPLIDDRPSSIAPMTPISIHGVDSYLSKLLAGDDGKSPSDAPVDPDATVVRKPGGPKA